MPRFLYGALYLKCCLSISASTRSTDNCARTVQRDDRLARIAAAVAAGRAALLRLQQVRRGQQHCAAGCVPVATWRAV
jgi:hypothetical protein